jgi:hypothetical protein
MGSYPMGYVPNLATLPPRRQRGFGGGARSVFEPLVKVAILPSAPDTNATRSRTEGAM